MALDNDLKCMQALTKLTDEERENVLEWAAKKWPKVGKTVTSGTVQFGGEPTFKASKGG